MRGGEVSTCFWGTGGCRLGSATAASATEATIVPVGEKQFLFLVSRTPHFALNVMRVLARRLRATNSVI
jgi:CRP-like cAMP-binding protein